MILKQKGDLAITVKIIMIILKWKRWFGKYSKDTSDKKSWTTKEKNLYCNMTEQESCLEPTQNSQEKEFNINETLHY